MPFVLDTDASATAIGATLYQDEKLIGLFSKKLSACQKNYTNTERELLAIIEALKHFRSIIYGTDLTIRTDHANLLNNPELQTSRAQRWKLILEEYNPNLMHIPGKENQASDLLSRCAYMGVDKEPKSNIQRILSSADITFDEQGRTIIPARCAIETIRYLHDYLGHPGATTLINTIRPFFNIQGMKAGAIDIRKACRHCQQFQIGRSNYGKLNGCLQTARPFKDISSDIVGPYSCHQFPGAHAHQKFWILTIIDRCTHWTKLSIIYDLTPQTVLKKNGCMVYSVWNSRLDSY